MHRKHWIWGLSAVAAAWSAAPTLADELISERALSRVGYSMYWNARFPLASGDTPVGVHYLDGLLYVATRLGEVHALDAAVGSPLWTRGVADSGRTVRRPAHLTAEGGRLAVLLTHAGGVVLADRLSGDKVVEINGMWAPGSRAVGDATMLFAGSSDGHLYAVRWHDPVHHTPVVRWRVLGGGPVTATPSLTESLLYFTSQSGKVFACTPDVKKTLIWQFTTEAGLDADATVDAASVYVAGLDRSLYRLDRETGALKWRFRMPSPLRDAPIVVEDTVYQYCEGSGLVAVEADSGKPQWEIPEATALVSRGGKRTCVRLRDETVAVAESTTGLVIGTLSLTPGTLIPTHGDGAEFFAISTDGTAACYAPRDKPHLRSGPIGIQAAPASQAATQPAPPEGTPPEAVTPSPEVNLDDPLRSPSDG